jgi:hypothetical protein
MSRAWIAFYIAYRGARAAYRTPPESEAAGLHPAKDDAT